MVSLHDKQISKIWEDIGSARHWQIRIGPEIGLMIFKKYADESCIGLEFLDQDWTRIEKFHSPFISAVACSC